VSGNNCAHMPGAYEAADYLLPSQLNVAYLSWLTLFQFKIWQICWKTLLGLKFPLGD